MGVCGRNYGSVFYVSMYGRVFVRSQQVGWHFGRMDMLRRPVCAAYFLDGFVASCVCMFELRRVSRSPSWLKQHGAPHPIVFQRITEFALEDLLQQ